jgi:hypothetical protein
VSKKIAIRCYVSLTLLWSPWCLSMQIHFESLDTVLQATPLAVVADISSVAEYQDGEQWRVLSLEIKVVKTIFGKHTKVSIPECFYRQGLPHQRGQMAVSPRVTGSGHEFNAKLGDRVILLMASASVDAKNCEILRMEPLKNERLVKTRKQQS